MKTLLYKGLNKDEEETIKREFAASYRLRNKMVEIIDSEIAKTIESMTAEQDLYEDNWRLRHISYLAEIKSLRKLKNFLQ